MNDRLEIAGSFASIIISKIAIEGDLNPVFVSEHALRFADSLIALEAETRKDKGFGCADCARQLKDINNIRTEILNNAPTLHAENKRLTAEVERLKSIVRQQTKKLKKCLVNQRNAGIEKGSLPDMFTNNAILLGEVV